MCARVHVRGSSWGALCSGLWRWKGASAPSSISPSHASPFSSVVFAKRREKARLQLYHRNRVLSRGRASETRKIVLLRRARDEIWVYACTINTRQVYRARRKMRFSRLPPSSPSSRPPLFIPRLCLVKVARVSRLKLADYYLNLPYRTTGFSGYGISLRKNSFFFPRDKSKSLWSGKKRGFFLRNIALWS